MYIVGFCNTERLNSVLGNLPPAVFERKMAAKNLLLCPKLLDHHNALALCTSPICT